MEVYVSNMLVNTYCHLSCDNHMTSIAILAHFLSRVVVVVLDNFHFDLSSIQLTSHEDSSTSTKHDSGHQPSSGSEGEREGNPIPEVEEDGEGRELEEAMTEHDSESRLDLDKDDEGESEGSTRRDEREQSTLKGEADLTKQLLLAKKIHKTIVSSILPSLEAVLTKRVSVHKQHYYTLVSGIAIGIPRIIIIRTIGKGLGCG